MTPGAIFVDAVGPSVIKYYWVRFVNVLGVQGAFNATAGVQGETGPDVEYLLDTLTNAALDPNSDYSKFAVRADFFYVMPSPDFNQEATPTATATGDLWYQPSTELVRTWTGSTWGAFSQTLPFVVNSSPQTINGVSVPAGVYMDAAFIKNGTITNAKIGNAAIDNAKIANLDAGKINTGFLSANRIEAGSISASKLDTSYLTVSASAAFLQDGDAAADVNANTTTINGGKITANTLSVSRIQSNTSGSYNSGTFGLGTGSSIASFQGVGAFSSASSSVWGLLVSSTAGPGLAAGTTSSSSAGGFYNSTSSSFVSHRTFCELATSTTAGYFTHVSSGRWILLANSTFAYQTSGGASGTFTGAHDSLVPISALQPVPGDIVVDAWLYASPNVYDCLCVNAVSTSASQKGVVGVIAERAGADHIPTALSKIVTDAGGRETVVLDTERYPDIGNYYMYVMNALGEGKINVCGQGGNIAIGDLIVASDIAGKGMKQSDDLVRACTVAKAREAVSFSSPSEIKQIACIYMAG
jgi:hypothetical protein